LKLRDQLVAEGQTQHPYLFFTDTGAPLSDVRYPYQRWERTLRRLHIRYRHPYVAQHTSVSWNLIVGRNPLLIAKEHGHRILTMLTVCAAWIEGAAETDIVALREAMGYIDSSGLVTRKSPGPQPTPLRQQMFHEHGRWNHRRFAVRRNRNRLVERPKPRTHLVLREVNSPVWHRDGCYMSS
jgi:hypothetical protein